MNFSKDWIDILNYVKEIIESNEKIWFRGMCDATFKLNSGIFREQLNRSELISKEKTNYYLFRNMGMLDHEKTDWDLLYIMQHHGVKTRLLDWTESFAVALFFAYTTWNQKSDAVVWLLKPRKLNELTINSYGYRVLSGGDNEYLKFIIKEGNTNSRAIFPVKNNKRVIAQQGVFTLQGNSMLPLEEELDGKILSEGVLMKINIPKELASDVEAFLRVSGINYYTLFPDLDGLARFINNPNSLNSLNATGEIVPDIPEEVVVT